MESIRFLYVRISTYFSNYLTAAVSVAGLLQGKHTILIHIPKESMHEARKWVKNSIPAGILLYNEGVYVIVLNKIAAICQHLYWNCVNCINLQYLQFTK